MLALTPVPGIEGKVVRRGGEHYENLRRGTCWHDRVPERYPEVIVIASSDSDVAGAVRLARDEGLGVAVRSGGHSWSGSHLRDNTVLIDMSNLRHVEVDLETSTGTVEPGITGVELSAMLATHGLFFPTGHSTGVGIGGYLLQGGFGWQGREYGPACLSVTAIDAVTADGELVHADENENSDLLWAARGAGPGFFAVVTRFYLTFYPRRPITMTSIYAFPPTSAKRVFEFVHEIGRDTPLELLALITGDPRGGDGPGIVLVGKAYTETEREAREQLSLLETFDGLGETVMAQAYEQTDHVTLTRTADGGRFDDTKRWLSDNMGTKADFADLWPTMESLIESWPAGWRTHLMVFNWDNPAAPPRPDMAFSIEGDFFYGLYAEWSDAADDDKMTDWATGHMRAWEPQATGMALSDENLINRPFPFVSDDNLTRLDELRAVWDPQGLFVPWLGRP
jgi:FAD/FMN-containing dehydrogenase